VLKNKSGFSGKKYINDVQNIINENDINELNINFEIFVFLSKLNNIYKEPKAIKINFN
jgi:hypothetical protein